MPITPQDLQNLFTRYGWSYKVQDENTLLMGFMGEAGQFTLGARISDNWLSLTIVKYLPPVPPERAADVFRHLLKLNGKISYVKFVLESDQDVVLAADVPCYKQVDYNLFATVLDILSYYADDAYPHLYALITSEQPPAKAGAQ